MTLEPRGLTSDNFRNLTKPNLTSEPTSRSTEVRKQAAFKLSSAALFILCADTFITSHVVQISAARKSYSRRDCKNLNRYVRFNNWCVSTEFLWLLFTSPLNGAVLYLGVAAQHFAWPFQIKVQFAWKVDVWVSCQTHWILMLWDHRSGQQAGMFDEFGGVSGSLKFQCAGISRI